MKRTPLLPALAFSMLSAMLWTGCTPQEPASGTGSDSGPAPTTNQAKLSGSIDIDGSNTVYPIMTAAVTEFSAEQPDVKVAAADAGTGSGFKKFIRGEIDIATASRPIEPEEVASAKEAGIDFIEIPVAFDGLSIVVHKSNEFLKSITIADLRKIWEPTSKVKMWNEVNPAYPAKPIVLYGPTSNHGTFDYFTEAVMGEKGASRTDYQQIQDYNALVQGVANDEGSLGYIGFSYVQQNVDKLTAVAVDSGTGAIAPSNETIENGTYAPLSRPLLLYISKKSYDEKPQVKAFVSFILSEKGRGLISAQGYVPLPAEAYTLAQARLDAATLNSVFAGAKPGTPITEVLKATP